MKTTIRTQALALILVLSSLGIGQQAMAWVSMDTPAQSYSFRFPKFEGETYQYETKAASQEEAFRKAADACFNHFKAGRHVSMDYGQDIIDICVNPRTI